MPMIPRARRSVAHDLRGGGAVVIRLSALGDVALTTGVLEHWRATRGLQVIFLTRKRFAPLLAGHPAVARVIAFAPAQLRGAAWVSVARGLAKEFRGLPLIDLHGSVRSRTLALFWPGRVMRYPNYAVERRLYLRSRSSCTMRLLLDADIPQRYAMALDSQPPPREALRPRLFLTASEIECARAALREAGIRSPFVAIHPYATHPLKTWPRATWIEMARLLAAASWEWVVVGRDPHPFMDAVDSGRDLTNRLDLRATSAVLALASVLVTPDSGPMHLAQAVGTPVVALFGPTSREWGFYPSGPRDLVMELPMPCRPCSLHGRRGVACGQECLTGIPPSSVVACLERIRS